MPHAETEVHPAQSRAGLGVLLEDVVDYAGLFPPASLDLETSLHNYLAYRRSDAAWMLGRFVTPVRQLSKIAAHPAVKGSSALVRTTVLATDGQTASEFVEAFREDVAAIISTAGGAAGVQVEAVEVRFPADLLETDVVTVRRFLNELSQVLERLSMDVYFEVPLTTRSRLFVPIVAGAAGAFNRQQDTGSARFGLKIRTGGTEPAHFPDAESVAYAIAASREAGTRLKATAGLHHPIRHYNDTAGVVMHGFLNLLVAAVMAAIHRLGEADLLPILLEEDPQRFEFLSDRVEYGGRKATVEQIARARREGFASFGSCSFLEPVDDLTRLGLLSRED